MMRFKGHKSKEDIEAKAKQIGLDVETSDYAKGGDCIFIFGLPNTENDVKYNVTNGCFGGETSGGVWFDERSNLDREPWYVDLLYFFLVPEVVGPFPGTVAPAYPGVYLVEPDGTGGAQYFAKWEGLGWMELCDYASEADTTLTRSWKLEQDKLKNPHSRVGWYGLAVQP